MSTVTLNYWGRPGLGITKSGRQPGKVTRWLNGMAIFDEMQGFPEEKNLWEFTSNHIDRSVYFRPVWAGTKIPVEMVYTHNSSFDTELLKRHITYQSHDTVVLDYMSYYKHLTISTGRQHGKNYTLKKLSEEMMSGEAYESLRYKTILPPRLYDHSMEEFGEDYMFSFLRGDLSPWNSREEKQEAFRRAYGLPDHSQIYGDPIEGAK